MDLEALHKTLGKGKLAGCTLVAGEEDALVEQAVDAITQSLVPQGKGSDFNFSRFDGKTATAADIEGAVRTVSLFGGRRLVVLKDAQELRAEEQKRLLPLLQKPVPGNTLVLVVRGGGADSRDPKRAKASKACKLLLAAVEKGGGMVVDCPRPRARELPALAERLLKGKGLGASSEALHALVAAVGEDLGNLIQAVEKLQLFKGGAGEIALADVRAVVVDTREESVFALTDAVSEGATERALGLLRRLIRDGESPLGLLSQLARHFRNLGRVKSLSRRGQTADEIRSALGLHPFVVKKCLAQAGRFSERVLGRRLRLLAEVDARLKRSRLPEELELERLIFALSEKSS